MNIKKDKIIAVVPVKSISERVPNKNFRPFTDDGLSLLDLTLNKLKNVKQLNQIYISTDHEDLNIESNEKLKIIKRKKEFCNNITPWSEVIFNVISSIPETENTIVLWAHTTCPLFDNYEDAINKYLSLDPDKVNSLVVVEKLKEFIIDNKGKPWNYMYGVWHKYSQDLPELYKIAGALFINKIGDMKKNRYVINTNPYLYEIDSKYGLDIDTPWQFRIAQLIYKEINGND